MHRKTVSLFILICLAFSVLPTKALAASQPRIASLQSASTNVYLPLITNNYQTPYTYRVDAPYFSGAISNVDTHFGETAITWFGQVSSSSNYADIRIGYSDQGLWVYISAFDRYLWYNPHPTSGTLAQWDGATLLINTNGVAAKKPDNGAYQFVSALSWFENRSAYQAAYRGNGSGWTSVNLNYSTVAGYRGSYNDGHDSRGWALTYEIPFSSLGLSGAPASGATWGIAMVMHDRDSQAGPPQADESWPVGMQSDQPATWAQLRFGLVSYAPSSNQTVGSVVIRQDSSQGVSVPDAAVGGTDPNLCPGDANFIWNQWGNTNYGKQQDFNIQNQSDVSDWPCFAKYYVTFPLNKIPANKVITSATLTLHQQGQAGDAGQSQPSLIQVLTVGQDWSETSITWNNAPPPLENVSQTWVNGDVVGCGSTIQWPCVPRSWDVSYAVNRAYQSGQPLRLVLYMAASDQHSGKYFTSSNSGSWNINGRPSLTVSWGN